jgi:hypothetical protein
VEWIAPGNTAKMSRQGFSVTGSSEARLFRGMEHSMAVDSDRSNFDEDPLENTELARRLRRMEWPPAPTEVKERVLRRIVSQGGEEHGSNGDQESPSGSSGD